MSCALQQIELALRDRAEPFGLQAATDGRHDRCPLLHEFERLRRRHLRILGEYLEDRDEKGVLDFLALEAHDLEAEWDIRAELQRLHQRLALVVQIPVIERGRAQVDPGVLDVFDMEATARELADINGYPIKGLRSPEAVMAMKEDRANKEQAAALLEAAPAVSSTAANLAKMQAAGGLQPGV